MCVGNVLLGSPIQTFPLTITSQKWMTFMRTVPVLSLIFEIELFPCYDTPRKRCRRCEIQPEPAKCVTTMCRIARPGIMSTRRYCQASHVTRCVISFHRVWVNSRDLVYNTVRTRAPQRDGEIETDRLGRGIISGVG